MTLHASTSLSFWARIFGGHDTCHSWDRHDGIVEAVYIVGRRLVVEFPDDDVHVAHPDEHAKCVV